MSGSVHIRTRKIEGGEERYDVRYRRGGREHPITHAGTFRTLEEAQARKRTVALRLAYGEDPAALAPDTDAIRGWVYFISDQRGYIKIGFASNVARRLAGLQHANPSELVVLGKWWATLTDERALHRRFAPFNAQGEWFRDVPELRSFIRQVCE